jgi:murein L,D-transpeptidase YcbB/YkuD
LKAELAALLAQAGQTPTASSIGPFPRNLSFGMTGNDVTALQNFLIRKASGPAAAKLAAHGTTRNFGALTYNALKEFQKKAGIAPASGFCGPKTRAYVNTAAN